MIVRGVFFPLLWATVGAGAATMASAEDSKAGVKEQRRIVIMDHADGKAPAGAGEFRLKRGADGKLDLPGGCEQGSAAADLNQEDGNKRTRVLICTKAGGSAAEQLSSLEKAKERLARNEHLSAELRAKIGLQLDAEIARLRGSSK
jgi:hypothetical protein